MSATSSFQKDKAKAEKKLEIAIDKLVDVKDLGFGDDGIERALETLNAALAKIRERCLMSHQ